MENEGKVRENRLRRMAERQGLRLVKSRRRDELARDFGTYLLVDSGTGEEVLRVRLSMDAVEAYLQHGQNGLDRVRALEADRLARESAIRAMRAREARNDGQ